LKLNIQVIISRVRPRQKSCDRICAVSRSFPRPIILR
jgi:hypothetical protein